MIKEKHPLRGTKGGCTGFMASKNDKVLVASNIDASVVDPKLEVYKPDELKGTYGRILFQYWYDCVDCRSTGVNEKGLWFDRYDHQFWPQLKTIFKKPYKKPMQLEAYCLSICSTVEEVKEEMEKYNLFQMSRYNAFFVDKTGDWVIIEGDNLYQKDEYNKYGIKYAVSTNFMPSKPNLPFSRLIGWEQGKWRYRLARYMLQNMDESRFNREYFRSICEATHTDVTNYSNVCDLKNGIIYLYHFKDYEKEREIKIKEYIKKIPEIQDPESPMIIKIPSLFEPKNNKPPEKPVLYGPTKGKIGQSYEYFAVSKDPEKHQIYFLFDWGDGTTSKICKKWIEPLNNITCQLKHRWIKSGDYKVKVKTRDIYGKESPWSDPLYVDIQKKKHPRILPPELIKKGLR